MLFFFFSSRRRHTRWTGDWSSDVCSSDLQRDLLAEQRAGAGERRPRPRADAGARRVEHPDDRDPLAEHQLARSEERRVGKECRARWAPDHYKKKRSVDLYELL